MTTKPPLSFALTRQPVLRTMLLTGLLYSAPGFGHDMAHMGSMDHLQTDPLYVHTRGQTADTASPASPETRISEGYTTDVPSLEAFSLQTAARATSHAHAHSGMAMPAALPPRSPDYSDGYVNHGEHAMHMGPQWGVAVHQLEFNLTHLPASDRAIYASLNAEAWYGSQENRAVIRVHSNTRNSHLEESAVRLSWRRPWTAFWNGELGLENNRLDGGSQQWLTASVVGIIPYWIYAEGTLKAAGNAQTATELTLNYNWRLTRQWGLQPQLDWIRYFHRRNSILPEQESGLGLRLFYKISPQFQPYIGYVYHHTLNPVDAPATTDTDSDSATSRQGVMGVSFWF